jgi:hypothetical protein
MDKVDEASIKLLIDAGDKMWNENKDATTKLVEAMCDDKFG